MSEINVLVNGNATPKVKGEAISKKGNSGTDSAAMEFAALFGGWMAQAMGQGQDSGFQSSDPAGKEANSGQTGFQGIEGMLGSLRTIAGLNLGSVSGQGQQGSEAMMKAMSPDIMTLLSQENLQGDVTDSGIGSGQLQGEKSPLSELDQYRVLITQLLQNMSGEISMASYKPTDIQGLLTQLSQELNLNTSSINVEKSNIVQNLLNENIALSQTQVGQGDLGQFLKELQSTLQGQSVLTQPESSSSLVSQEQVASAAQILKSSDLQTGLQNKANEQVTSTGQVANLSDIRTGLQSRSSEQITESAQNSSNMPIQKNDIIQELTTGSNQNNETVEVMAMPLNKNLSQNFTSNQNVLSGKTLNGSQQDGLLTGNHLLQMNIQNEAGQNGNGNEKYNFSGNGNITNHKDDGTEGTNSILGNFNLANLNLNSISGVGNQTEISQNLPIWLQVSQELQAKVLHQLPAVRELNIQLHPAELGQISISLTLDNGQVHLHMLASEAATGQVLQNNFPELRESLSQSGVQCGMMQMGFSDPNQNSNQGRNQTFTPQIKNQDNQVNQESEDVSKAGAAVLSLKNSELGISQKSRINVTA